MLEDYSINKPVYFRASAYINNNKLLLRIKKRLDHPNFASFITTLNCDAYTLSQINASIMATRRDFN